MKKLVYIAITVFLVLGLFACGNAQNASSDEAGSAAAPVQDTDEPAIALFGGAAFVFGCDDSTVRIPCTYSE